MGETTEEWKTHIIIPIYTKGGKQNVENYTVLNEFYKIRFSIKFERTSKTVPSGLPEWILKRQMLH
jgi:hypothetical protein